MAFPAWIAYGFDSKASELNYLQDKARQSHMPPRRSRETRLSGKRDGHRFYNLGFLVGDCIVKKLPWHRYLRHQRPFSTESSREGQSRNSACEKRECRTTNSGHFEINLPLYYQGVYVVKLRDEKDWLSTMLPLPTFP
ncbi:unnamed protein product [Sympodiomycopsis kandeliae]